MNGVPVFLFHPEETVISIDTQVPITLSKAQLALCLRTLALLQQGRQQWLDQALKTIGENMEETRTETAQLLQSEDWQALAALPGHATWRLMHRQMAGLQATVQTALSNQTQFTAGWQQALGAWQQESAKALSFAGTAMPLHASLRAFAQSWGALYAGNLPR